MTDLHAHMTGQSADCDGTYSRGQVYEMTTQEKAAEWPEHDFKERVLTSTVSLIGHGTLTVTPDGFSWHEQTDEGYRAADVHWCEDDCADKRTWQRDHRAEAAGY